MILLVMAGENCGHWYCGDWGLIVGPTLLNTTLSCTELQIVLGHVLTCVHLVTSRKNCPQSFCGSLEYNIRNKDFSPSVRLCSSVHDT